MPPSWRWSRARPGRPDLVQVDVAFESGDKRVFAVALDWPGWARGGRSPEEALEALAAYAERYARAIDESDLTGDVTYEVVERLQGGATTDFGAPGEAAAADDRPLDDAETDRQVGLVRAAWHAFDDAALGAATASLRTGPRGGGRDVPKMRDHVLEAEAIYLSKLGSRRPHPATTDPGEVMGALREAGIAAFRARAAGREPETPSAVKARWSPRYWARRSAWHALDHAWEIEDRMP